MTRKYYTELMRSSPHNAHKALVDEYINYVYTIVYNKLRSTLRHEDIEECVSDVFADVFLGLDDQSNYEGDLKGYIGTVAKRRAIDYYRRQKNRRIVPISINDENINELTSEFDVEREVIGSETQRIIFDKIKLLGEPDSTIIIYKFYYNKSSTEIATILSMKASAVRMRSSRALKRLKESLAEIIRE